LEADHVRRARLAAHAAVLRIIVEVGAGLEAHRLPLGAVAHSLDAGLGVVARLAAGAAVGVVVHQTDALAGALCLAGVTARLALAAHGGRAGRAGVAARAAVAAVVGEAGATAATGHARGRARQIRRDLRRVHVDVIGGRAIVRRVHAGRSASRRG